LRDVRDGRGSGRNVIHAGLREVWSCPAKHFDGPINLQIDNSMPLIGLGITSSISFHVVLASPDLMSSICSVPQLHCIDALPFLPGYIDRRVRHETQLLHADE
jgi:hypothetical protein